ncbi:hypothetical protein PSQ33_006284 [Pseudomonas aeruginosa]|uniref:Uncharacterized protein n=1 Tax=Pseudomonas saponiphila TaxID=556534 RepID=A0A1H5AHA1_9PSED|nr:MULTISPECIES: hypothetical protein [Pseudomonas]EKL8567297.1 hypothetical protein [Pseudomonas aeruginosa]ELI9047640.1 hypothetical protein [Pseudomonas aeruginosa]MBA1318847.1 hypothetical protein [Pseudomonas monteilii]MBA6105840.1 hypothetical protein [Pseudomonas monteilii]MDT8222594.1 hypothetical protein [Pseudomonas aeruginosa]
MPTVSFRCTETQKIELEERSQGDISEYVRRQLFRQMEQEDTLEMILQRLDQRPGGAEQPSAGIDRQSMAILIELLLLLRTASKPDAKREAQAEVERLGLDVWDSSKRDS